MGSRLLEKDIEVELVRAVEKVGGIAYKFTSPQRANVPDRICVFPNGRAIWVEVKRPGEKPTSAQEREHARLKVRFQRVRVVDSFEGVALVVSEGIGER